MALHDNEMRAVYTDTLIELMKENSNVICLEADLGKATGTFPKVRDAFPDRFINVGVAEANMIGVGSGLANEGKIPFCASFSCFAGRRVYDQVTISAAYSNNNVKIVGTSPGISATMNGGTHMCFQDISIMRAVPNMHVYSPADAYELRAVLRYMATHRQPTYMQLLREKYAQIFNDSVEFDPMKAKVLSSGSDVTLVSTGLTTQFAVKAVQIARENGLSIEHLHYPSIKPFDAKTLIESVKKTRCVVTVDNGSVIGGIGSAVSDILSEQNPALVKKLGAQDRFGEVGTLDYLAETIGISSKQIAEACKELKSRK